MRKSLVCSMGLMAAVLLAGCGSGNRPAVSQRSLPPLNPVRDNRFELKIPKGWQLKTGGDCSSLAFVAEDPSDPRLKIIYFGLAGPFYLSPMQKQMDWQYMNSGGFPIEWVDCPVASPLTPETALMNFAALADSSVARRFMPGCPRLQDFQVVSMTRKPPVIRAQGAQAALVRGIFNENGRPAEALIELTTALTTPMMGGPGGGIGHAYLMAGISAPVGELDAWAPLLLESLQSFQLRPAYVQQCGMQASAAWGAVQAAGQTLRETSDSIMSSWEARNRSDDILSQKRSDVMLGKERLVDTETGEVYEFNNGFYDTYSVNPEQYRNPNLERLPADDHDLWTAPTADGYDHLRIPEVFPE